jgi:hypothetical protein
MQYYTGQLNLISKKHRQCTANYSQANSIPKYGIKTISSAIHQRHSLVYLISLFKEPYFKQIELLIEYHLLSFVNSVFP